jgi:hypothetical protein
MNHIPQPLVIPDDENALQHFNDAMARLEQSFAQKREQAEDANEQRKLEKRCWWRDNEP